jgi:hypothetical protein
LLTLLLHSTLLWAVPIQHSDLYRPRRKKQALVLVSPGWKVEQYSFLMDHLDKVGMNVWVLEFPADEQTWENASALIAASVESLPPQKTAVVAHGYAGTILADALIDGTVEADAVALIGVPLAPPCSKAIRSGFQIALGEPAELNDPWPILYGSQSSPILSTGPSWSEDLLSWCMEEDELDLGHLSTPIWAVGSGMDNVAPPEMVVRMLGKHEFLRAGPLSLHQYEPDHFGLLHHLASIRLTTRWLQKTLRKA